MAYILNEMGEDLVKLARDFVGAMSVTDGAIQILGGYGYSREHPVEKLHRDAKIFQIFAGANQIQQMVISSQILAKY